MNRVANMGKTPAQLIWGRFRQHTLAVGSALVLVALAGASLLAPVFEMAMGLDANAADLFNRFKPPSLIHPLGTDELGRDLFLRLLYGGRVSLLVGVVAAIFATVIGTAVGLTAGYFGGRTDAFLMRVTDGVISLPLLPLLIVLAAIDLSNLDLPRAITESEDASLYRIIVIVSLAGWTTVGRLVRASTLSIKQRTFVMAAVAQGGDPFRIMRAHILPNLASPIIVATTLAAGNIILLESVLSFLGLGIQPPLPSWGNLLTNAQEIIWEAPLQAFYPGVFIFITVIALNFIGDGLQDALDPRPTVRRLD